MLAGDSTTGVYTIFFVPRAHFTHKSRKNDNYKVQIFSVQKKLLLRPRFLRLSGSG